MVKSKGVGKEVIPQERAPKGSGKVRS